MLSLQSGKGGQETVPDWKFVGQKVQRSFGKVAKQQQQQRGVNCHQGPKSQNWPDPGWGENFIKYGAKF